MKEEIKQDKPTTTPKKKQTLKEKVRQHINDKNDVITDEDIRDAVVGGAVSKEIVEKTKEMLEEQPKHKKGTPWDVLEDDNG